MKLDRSLFINLISNKKEQWSRWKLFVYLVFNIESAQKGDIKVYQTNCHGICRDISVKIEYDSGGDADLYTKEDSPPTESAMKGASCPDCLCTSKRSTSPDVCLVTTTGKYTRTDELSNSWNSEKVWNSNRIS